MMSLEQCLARHFDRLHLEDERLLHYRDVTVVALFGHSSQPLLALGLDARGQRVLGTPCLFWGDIHRKEWAIKPLWTVPEEWDEPLDSKQASQLEREAKSIAKRRKSLYKPCHKCDTSTMPEELIRSSVKRKLVCHSCAEADGVMF